MLKYPQDITVDLNVELTNNVINSIHVNQYEHKSREINIYVKRDGIDYPVPNDLTVNIRIHKSNGYDIYKTIGKDIGGINGNIITILIDESMTIAAGRQTCDIEFIDSDGNRLYSTKFYINVHKSALDDNNIKDNDDYTTIQTWARESKEYAKLSESYAVGTENQVREHDATDNAKYYKKQSEINANNALEYSEQSKSYADDSKSYADNASVSATNATKDAQQAEVSARQASSSAVVASNKAEQAAASAASANTSNNEASNAASSAGSAAEEAVGANRLAQTAKDKAEQAKNIALEKALEADASATNAINSASTATSKASDATNAAKEAKSYAVGGTDIRENEDIDNSQYYYEQAKSISESFTGALRPMGTVTFGNLPALSTATEGDMYNISDEFTTNDKFKEGAGLTIPAGANIYKTADGMWDVLAGSPVTSVNGMRGNVTITPYSLPLATSSIRGGVKTGYIASGKNYPVQLSNEQMYVNVPWTDTNTWRPTQDNLTSTSTTESLSANQGRILNNKLARRMIYNNSGGTTGNLTFNKSDFTGCLFYTIGYSYGTDCNVTDVLITEVGNSFTGKYSKMLVITNVNGQIIQELREPIALTFTSNQVTLTRGNMYFYNVNPSSVSGFVTGQTTLIKINSIIGYIIL